MNTVFEDKPWCVISDQKLTALRLLPLFIGREHVHPELHLDDGLGASIRRSVMIAPQLQKARRCSVLSLANTAFPQHPATIFAWRAWLFIGLIQLPMLILPLRCFCLSKTKPKNGIHPELNKQNPQLLTDSCQ